MSKRQEPPATLPADFFSQKKTGPPDTLPADFFNTAQKEDVSVTLDYGGGQRSTSDSILEGAGEFVDMANPIPVSFLKSVYERGTIETLKGIPAAQADQFAKAKESFNAGNYTDAARYTLGWLIPLYGPAANERGDQLGRGEYAKGIGGTLGLGAGIALPAAVSKISKVSTAPKSRLNPVEQAAVNFGEREGVPLDLATRTGNGYVRGAQNILQKQPGATGYVQNARQAQADALARTGQRLADRAHPTAVSPEQAGQGVIDTVTQRSATIDARRSQRYAADRDAVRNRVNPDPVSPEQAGAGLQSTIGGRVSLLKKFEDEAYGKFREIADDPANRREVQVGSQSAAMKPHFDTLVEDHVQIEMKTWARGTREAREFRIASKEDVPRRIDEATALNAGGKELDEIATANARKIGSSGTKENSPLEGFKEFPKQLAEAIEKGKGKLYDRIHEAFTESIVETYGPDIRTSLREAGVRSDGATVPILKKMQVPVDMRPIKSQLKATYEQMQQWMEPAKRNASRGFQAIKSIVEGPDYLPATVAEQGLGGLKALAREAASPDMRDVNAGLGANAAKRLQAQIDEAVTGAGPEAIDALKAGRMGHAAKMDAAEVLDTLRDEPVQAFNQAVWANDAGIDRLREVAKLAPNEMAKVGRAYLDKMFTAGNSTDMQVVKAAQKQWQSLGPQTKKVLFQDPADVFNVDRMLKRGSTLLEPSQSTQILKSMSKEPVTVFNRAVWANDAGIVKLREMSKVAPKEMSKIGRAFIEELLEKATAEGKFDRTAGVLADWRALGPETRKLLFKNPELIKDLDNFFLLAKKIAENPNPSGTAATLLSMGTGALFVTNPITAVSYTIGSNVMARMLFSPNGSKALMKGLTVPLGNKAAAALAASTILKLAGEDAVRVKNSKFRAPAMMPAH